MNFRRGIENGKDKIDELLERLKESNKKDPKNFADNYMGFLRYYLKTDRTTDSDIRVWSASSELFYSQSASVLQNIHYRAKRERLDLLFVRLAELIQLEYTKAKDREEKII